VVPSGSEKTYSALLLAYGITNDWNKIALIDTENKSASLYSHLGDFNPILRRTMALLNAILKAIKLCEESDIEIIIDLSATKWQGKGGCLRFTKQLGITVPRLSQNS
jgi:hypothetical protein